MIAFILKESLRPVKKAKASFLISLISVSISIFLITLSYFLYDISGAVQKKLKSSIELNVFVNDSLSNSETGSVESSIKALGYVSSAEYISKSAAAEIFTKETGEDFSKILDYNPLPASFKIKLHENQVTPSILKKAVREISSLKGVDEVSYENETAERVLSFINTAKKYIVPLAVILVIISIYIMYSTARLILKLRADEMETMKLIGAPVYAIKVPVIINALLTGILAGVISLGIFSLFINSIEDYIYMLFSYKFKYFYLLSVTILTGPVLGVIISYLSLRKISLKI